MRPYFCKDKRFHQIATRVQVIVTDERLLSALTPEMWRGMLQQQGWVYVEDDLEQECEIWCQPPLGMIALPKHMENPDYPELVGLVLQDVAEAMEQHPFQILEWLAEQDDIFIYF